MSSTRIVTKVSKAAALAQVQAIIAGTEKHFPSGQFTLGNAVYTTASLLQVLQGLETALAAANTAQASAKDALSSLRTTEASASPVIQAYVRYVRATYGSSTQNLADFGLAPPKARAPLTSEEKAAAAAKSRATREARGTKGKKQKLAVTGNVTGITITPVTAPSSSPTQQPAPIAPNVAPRGHHEVTAPRERVPAPVGTR